MNCTGREVGFGTCSSPAESGNRTLGSPAHAERVSVGPGELDLGRHGLPVSPARYFEGGSMNKRRFLFNLNAIVVTAMLVPGTGRTAAQESSSANGGSARHGGYRRSPSRFRRNCDQSAGRDGV